MRLRPIAALSVAAVSAVLLAGCSGLGGAESTPTASPTVAADLCSSAAPSGAASDAVTVSGDFGTEPTVDFSKPIDADGLTLERTVSTEGDGEAIAAGDFVSYAATILDGSTGKVISASGYEAGQILPEQISPENGGQLFGCAPVGSRITVVAATNDQTTPTVVYVIDVLGITPTAAWGEPQAPVAGLPTVTLDENGTPNIAIDTAVAPPAETQVATLKKGDGPVVQSGDTVLIQFRGARWSTGELFDGGDTWATDTPYTGATTGFVPGFTKALEGQTVGSQVLVVITPADGYGAGEINTADLKGETLVFVIDILATSVTSSTPQ